MGIYQEAVDSSMFNFFTAVKLFQSSYTIFTCPSETWEDSFLHILTETYHFYCLALLVGVKWYLITTLSFHYQF